MADKKFNPVFAENRKARHDYTVLETIECGIVLTGTEVKSVRHGEISLSGSYGAVLKGELWLVGADIAAYKFGNRFNHEPKSMRKLLVHAKEVRDLQLKTEAKGLTLIPLKVFLKNGRVKVDLGVCRGKQLHDKRDALKKKAMREGLFERIPHPGASEENLDYARPRVRVPSCFADSYAWCRLAGASAHYSRLQELVRWRWHA